MQNGMIPAQPAPHDRPYFVPTSNILIPPSKSGETRRRLARPLVGRHVCRLGGPVDIPGGWCGDWGFSDWPPHPQRFQGRGPPTLRRRWAGTVAVAGSWPVCHLSGPGTTSTLITGCVWLLGLPCTVPGLPPSLPWLFQCCF